MTALRTLALSGLAAAIAGTVALGVFVVNRPAETADLVSASAGAAVGVAFGVEAPDLDEPAMVRRGAAHYDRFCAGCHASPAQPARAAALKLRPPAPVLHLRIGGWPEEYLFKVVRDGVPDSAMPAWPSPGREDEVWDMVAFLRVLPQLDPVAYLEIARRPVAPAIPHFLRTCVGCHGPDGSGGQGIPRLDIQTRTYLSDALHAFRDGRRASGVMRLAVAGTDDATLERMADYFAGSPPPPRPGTPPDLVLHGVPGRKVPPCAACHGDAGSIRAEVPRLLGQERVYLERQLRLFAGRGEQRGGGPWAHVMREAGQNLSENDIQDAVDWYGRDAVP